MGIKFWEKKLKKKFKNFFEKMKNLKIKKLKNIWVKKSKKIFLKKNKKIKKNFKK
jgi:hypothetical protein